MSRYRVGVDIGGTFTDIVLLGDDGSIHTKKISSSVADYSAAIIEGLAAVLAELSASPGDLAEIRHGTTVASNALLERKGAKTGLIATKGFRDILEIRNLRMPRLYDLTWEKPPPLVERFRRVVVDERVDTEGNVQTALDAKDVARAIDRLLDEDVEAIAVCLINSYANPTHELQIKEIAAARAPDCTVSISYEVLPEIKEYERTSTTVINAYIMPIVQHYLRRLRESLGKQGSDAPLLIMQSSGGLTSADEAARRPVNIVESGPAGGVVGARALAQGTGLENLITFDMGGTTAKAAMIENGEASRAEEYQVGGGILTGSRLMTGGGYLVKMPSVDLAEVGAGGGSLVAIDAGGAMQVGPESAGASPGPVCYDQGGTEPTVTDANIILGYLNPDYLVGGELRLNAEMARTVFQERIAVPLDVALEDAAYGAHQIVASNMIRAIRSVSTERGRDPRGFALCAFGGNGPVFGAAMAAALGIKRVLIPPAPGLFSSFGLLRADVEHHLSRTFRGLLKEMDRARLGEAWDALTKEAMVRLASDGFTGADVQIERAASLHYQGQTYELTVPVASGPLDENILKALEDDFHAEHERTYGHRAGAEEPVELVNIRVLGRGVHADMPTPKLDAARGTGGIRRTRPAYFGPAHGWQETEVIGRGDLPEERAGPLIIEEYDATGVVPPGARAGLDRLGNIQIDLA